MENRKVVDKAKFFKMIDYQPHAKQVEFHRSNARFKVAACGRRAGKTYMTAKDIEPFLFVPDKRIWLVGPTYCVDQETEILTNRGWLSYWETKHGDQALTLNDDGLAEWQAIDSVHTFAGPHEVIEMKWRGHNSVTTPNHRWLVGYTSNNRIYRGELGYRFTTTENLNKSNEFIPTAAPVLGLPAIAKYSDSLVEIVAWYWTEGHDQEQGTGLLITQNFGSNYERIQQALTEEFGPESTPSEMLNKYDITPRWRKHNLHKGVNSKYGNFGLNSRAGSIIRNLAPNKVVRPDFICSLTLSQLELFINVSVLADGHDRTRKRHGSERIIVQDKKARLDTIQMACQLAGYQTTLLHDGKRYILRIFNRNKIWPGQREQRKKHYRKIITGKVWCPKTPNGTWLARRGGTVYFTGNTLGEKEFRVIWGDIMSKLKFAQDPEIKKAYNLKQGDMYIQFPWGTRIEVHSAERKETLVGDGLDLVVMCEAAKHQRETWDRMIEPALADRRGKAIFTSTPEGQNFFYELWQRGLDINEPDYESWQYPSWDNSVIFPGGLNDPEIQRLKRNMTRDAFEQEIAADFTSFTGKIYKDFLDRTHVKNHEYRPDWPNYIAFDFGFVNPLAAIEFQVSPQDTIHIWREHYEKGLIMGEHIDLLKSREQPTGYKIDLCFGDAADPEAIMYISLNFAPCVGDPLSKDNWREGIDTVKTFLKPRGNGPGLFVDPSCRNTIREFNNYKSAEGGKDRDPREMAKKCDDHAMDAIRYGIMHIFKLGMRVRLADVMDIRDLKEGLSDSGFFTQDIENRYPALSGAGFVTLDDQRF